MRLEELTRGTVVKGILPGLPVTVIDVNWYGNAAVEITYKDRQGQTGQEILYRDREPSLELVSPGQTWQLDADGARFRLVSEAYRIRLAHLFDPMLAVHTSIIEPLPHQITAVYGEMLPRQPLRYLLADDPGAGKTIMAGLFIRELFNPGRFKKMLDLRPGILVEQWQEELSRRFQLPFEIISRQSFQDSLSGNPFAEKNLIICRLDHLSRNDDIQEKLKQTDCRRTAWKETGHIPGFYDQCRDLKTNHWHKLLPSQSAQEILGELDDSYRSWYSHRKNGDRKAHPPGFR